MFWKKKETKEPISKVTYFATEEPISKVTYLAPPPPPQEVAKIQTMLSEVATWMRAGETEIAKKHWMIISEECRKYATDDNRWMCAQGAENRCTKQCFTCSEDEKCDNEILGKMKAAKQIKE